MLANHVGEDRFLKGVSIYLKAHLFANRCGLSSGRSYSEKLTTLTIDSVTGDLWKGIAESTGTESSSTALGRSNQLDSRH